MPPKLKSEATEWKSRFPVARIKKIMQADDDVGKVAQVVPVILSKALELFMQNLVQAAAEQAINTGHKRVLPGHLKLAVKADSKFDFLEDQVEKLPDVSQAPVQQGSAGNAGPGGGSEGRRPRQRSTNPARGRPQSQQQQTVSSPLPGMAEASTGMPAPAHASQTGAYMPDFATTSGSSQADAQARPAMPSPMETQAQAQGQEPPLKRSRVSDLLSPSD